MIQMTYIYTRFKWRFLSDWKEIVWNEGGDFKMIHIVMQMLSGLSMIEDRERERGRERKSERAMPVQKTENWALCQAEHLLQY